MTIDILKQYRDFKKDCGLKIRSTDWVFTNWDSNKVLDPNRLTADWCAFRKQNNIKKDVSVHGLRHSNATYLLSQNIPDKDVAKRLGHTTEILARVYTHSNLEDDKKIVEKLEEKFYCENNKFDITSIASVIANNVDNEYKLENYRLLDYLVNDRVNNDNINQYLSVCQSYLLKQFPILDTFTYDEVANDKTIFNDKINSYKSFLGEKLEINKISNDIQRDNIKI